MLVLSKDGQHFVAKFKEHKGNFIIFYDHETIRADDVRTLAIWKGERKEQ